MKFIVRLVICAIALAVISYLNLFHVHANSITALLIGALVLGLLNAIIRPILLVASCPLEVVTLGLFTLIINALLFYFGLKYIPGWTVLGFWDAFWASIVFSIISWILSLMLGEKREDREKAK
ncbi:MAG TPA: phage holin family protein [Candidatus Eremiobacteraceae bacterium]|nr:phage holin family protein [Candidatus Eremiobacteraceae bacterium]